MNSSFHADFLRRHRVDDFHCAVVRRDPEGTLVLGAIYETRVAKLAQARAHFEHIVPHLARAAMLRTRFRAARLAEDALEALATAIGAGVVVYRGATEVSRHGLADALLGCARPTAALDAALARSRSSNDGSHLTIRLRGAAELDLIAVISARPSAGLRFQHGVERIVFLLGPESRGPGQVSHLLEQLYGLSQAEVSLCVRLARGLLLKEAAAELRLQPSTVRSQLLSVFRKTHTRRQAELLLLLGRLARLPVVRRQSR